MLDNSATARTATATARAVMTPVGEWQVEGRVGGDNPVQANVKVGHLDTFQKSAR